MIYIPETYTVDQQIKHDLKDLIAHVSISVHGLEQDILLQKLKWLRKEVEEYISAKERE